MLLERKLIMTLFEELKWRGLIQDMSSPEIENKLNISVRVEE